MNEAVHGSVRLWLRLEGLGDLRPWVRGRIQAQADRIGNAILAARRSRFPSTVAFR